MCIAEHNINVPCKSCIYVRPFPRSMCVELTLWLCCLLFFYFCYLDCAHYPCYHLNFFGCPRFCCVKIAVTVCWVWGTLPAVLSQTILHVTFSLNKKCEYSRHNLPFVLILPVNLSEAFTPFVECHTFSLHCCYMQYACHKVPVSFTLQTFRIHWNQWLLAIFVTCEQSMQICALLSALYIS